MPSSPSLGDITNCESTKDETTKRNLRKMQQVTERLIHEFVFKNHMHRRSKRTPDPRRRNFRNPYALLPPITIRTIMRPCAKFYMYVYNNIIYFILYVTYTKYTGCPTKVCTLWHLLR